MLSDKQCFQLFEVLRKSDYLKKAYALKYYIEQLLEVRYLTSCLYEVSTASLMHMHLYLKIYYTSNKIITYVLY